MVRLCPALLFALATLLPLCSWASAGGPAERDLPDMSYVEYREDFLGDQVPDPLHVSVAGRGRVSMSETEAVNGWLELAGSDVESVARVRLGEDRDDSPVHHLNFSTQHRARGTTRIIITADVGLEATIGFTGKDDPANVGGALLYRSDTQTWYLQCTREYTSDRPENSTVVDTRWKHTPGVPFVATIRTSPNEVTAHIDGKLVAIITTNIPTADGLAWEFQIWNKQHASGRWSAPTMFVDYLAIRQDRNGPRN